MPTYIRPHFIALALISVGSSGCALSLKPRSVECKFATILARGASCADLPRASDASDEEAKRFSPASGKSNIYVVRPSIVGGRYLWNIEIDGRPIGAIAEHTYLLAQIDPGQHELVVIAGENRHSMVLKSSEGENLVFEVVSRMGWTVPRAELLPMPLAEGREAVRGARRANSL